MLNWVLELVFDTSDCIFIPGDSDFGLHYKRLNWFLECQVFLYIEVQSQKSQVKSFL